MSKYTQIDKSQVPADVRFDVPGRYQGQTIEVAYGGFSRGEHDDGDQYKRVHDRGVGGGTTYYKLADDPHAQHRADAYDAAQDL